MYEQQVIEWKICSNEHSWRVERSKVNFESWVSTHLSLKLLGLVKVCDEYRSMRNCIRWKKDEVAGGGCFRIRMSSGSGDFMHNVLFWQTLSAQHSLSAQSTSPSNRWPEESIC